MKILYGLKDGAVLQRDKNEKCNLCRMNQGRNPDAFFTMAVLVVAKF